MYTLILIALAAADATAPEPAGFSAGNAEIRGYCVEAAESHPALAALHAEWRAALERVPQVTSLDDPMFSFGYFIQSDAQRFRVMLSQRFPWFGTLRARGNAAGAEAEAAFARLCNARNRIFADVKQAYAEYLFLAERMWLIESQLELLRYIEDIVTGRLALAMAGEEDLLRVSIERTRRADTLAQLAQMEPVAVARLNAAIGTPALTERPRPQPAAFPPAMPPVEEAIARARLANPGIEALDHAIAARGHEVALARKRGYPNFEIGLEFMDMKSSGAMGGGQTDMAGSSTAMTADPMAPVAIPRRESRPDVDDAWQVMVSMNLPIWRGRVRAGVREAQRRAEAAEHTRRHETIALEAAVRQAMFEVQDAHRRHTLFEANLIPQAQRTFESLQSKYAAGLYETGFLDVIDSVQQLLDFEIEQTRAVRDWHVAAAELEFLLGGPWGDGDAGGDGSALATASPLE